jgi:hypothetical protein
MSFTILVLANGRLATKRSYCDAADVITPGNYGLETWWYLTTVISSASPSPARLRITQVGRGSSSARSKLSTSCPRFRSPLIQSDVDAPERRKGCDELRHLQSPDLRDAAAKDGKTNG